MDPAGLGILTVEKKPLRLYNILLPIWMLVWWPSLLWLLLIPGNYLIDRLVFRRSLRGREDRDILCRKHTWKLCLAGFLSDFAGALLLFTVYAADLSRELTYALAFAPFRHWGAFVITALAVALGGGLIYLLDRRILKRSGFDAAQAGRSARWLALVTAPYLFLFPSGILYR